MVSEKKIFKTCTHEIRQKNLFQRAITPTSGNKSFWKFQNRSVFWWWTISPSSQNFVKFKGFWVFCQKFSPLFSIFSDNSHVFQSMKNFKQSVCAGYPKEQPCQFSFQLVKQFQRRRCLKKANDDRQWQTMDTKWW